MEKILIVMLEACDFKSCEVHLVIRFLDDYINGDTYFKIEYNKQNLYRTKAQLALVKDIETKLDYMESFIKRCYKQNANIKTLKK